MPELADICTITVCHMLDAILRCTLRHELFQVADIAVEALVEPAAFNKVVEVVADQDSPLRSLADLFASVS